MLWIILAQYNSDDVFGYIRIVFSPYIVAVVCLVLVLSSEADNNAERIEKVFDSFQIVNIIITEIV